MSHLPVGGETIEDVVAAVGNTPILSSDLALARAIKLIEQRPTESDTAFTQRLLETRINLELQFRDLEASGTLYRLDMDVDGKRAELISRGGGREVVIPELERNGLTLGDLEDLSLRMASATAYIEQRLRPRIRVTAEEIQATYRDVVVSRLEDAGQPIPPLDDVHNEIRTLLVERSLSDEIELWLEAAAEQHEVTLFYRPAVDESSTSRPLSSDRSATARGVAP
jgi:hypothetical protein